MTELYNKTISVTKAEDEVLRSLLLNSTIVRTGRLSGTGRGHLTSVVGKLAAAVEAPVAHHCGPRPRTRRHIDEAREGETS